jgi:inosine/xanthosine triphosphate pyrophosphatase family protein
MNVLIVGHVAYDGDGRTFAEMAPAEKNAISHRAKALIAIADRIREI